MESKLKKGAFGYNSKEVEAYLLEISGRYLEDVKAKEEKIDSLSDDVDKLTEQVDSLTAQLEKLGEEKAELEGKLANYEEERLSVADALVKAQKEAQEILRIAEEDAKNAKAQAEAEHMEYLKKIEDAKCVLADMKKSALKLMDEYRDCVEKFTDFKAACHDD